LSYSTYCGELFNSKRFDIMRKELSKNALIIPAFLSFTSIVSAQASDEPAKLDFTMIGEWADVIVQNITNVLVVVAVVMVIYGGYMYMFAAGDSGKIKQAQGTITWAIIGLVFSFIIKGILYLFAEVIS